MFLSLSGRGKAGILLGLFGLLEGGLRPDLLRTGNEIIDVGHDWLLGVLRRRCRKARWGRHRSFDPNQAIRIEGYAPCSTRSPLYKGGLAVGHSRQQLN